MPFLRPLALPRSATVRQFLRFSTARRCAAETASVKQHAEGITSRSPRKFRRCCILICVREDRNLIASRSASGTYPPHSSSSLPRPKISRASRRTAHPPKQRQYPTRHFPYVQLSPNKLIPEPIQHLPEDQSAPNLEYFVTRTKSNELPVYTDTKRGGNLKLTTVRKIDGNPEVLRDALRERPGLEGKRVVVNEVTKHVVIKGHVKPEVIDFLRERRF
jgi:large subunit ribosomal protein L49